MEVVYSLPICSLLCDCEPFSPPPARPFRLQICFRDHFVRASSIHHTRSGSGVTRWTDRLTGRWTRWPAGQGETGGSSNWYLGLVQEHGHLCRITTNRIQLLPRDAAGIFISTDGQATLWDLRMATTSRKRHCKHYNVNRDQKLEPITTNCSIVLSSLRNKKSRNIQLRMRRSL